MADVIYTAKTRDYEAMFAIDGQDLIGLRRYGAPTEVPSEDIETQSLGYFRGLMDHPVMVIEAKQQGTICATRIAGQVVMAMPNLKTNGLLLKAGTVIAGNKANVGDVVVLRGHLLDKVINVLTF